MKEIILKKVQSDKNEHKLYRLVLVDQGLGVLHQWGRIGEWVQEKWSEFESYEAALKDFERTEKSKRKDGYIDGDWSIMPSSYRLYKPGQKTAQPVKEEPRRFIQLNWLDLLIRKKG